MSDRERWILYPILFFSLALGIKTKWDAANGESHFRRIVCSRLEVQSALGEPRLLFGESNLGGAYFKLFDVNGNSAAALQSGEGGGALLLFRSGDQKAIALGHDSELRLSGIMAFDEKNGGRLIPLDSQLKSPNGWQLIPWTRPPDSDNDSKSETDSTSPPDEPLPEKEEPE